MQHAMIAGSDTACRTRGRGYLFEREFALLHSVRVRPPQPRICTILDSVSSLEGGAFKPLLYPSSPRIDSRHLCSWGILSCDNIRLLDIVYIRSNRMF